MHAASIRPPRPEESDALTALALRSKRHWGYDDAFMAACHDELTVTADAIESARQHYRVAEHRGEILGFYALERLARRRYELEALFVEPRHIGRGIGRMLLEHAKAFAEERGAEWILIQGDPHATAFYLAMGCVRCGERESSSVPGRMLPEFRVYLTV